MHLISGNISRWTTLLAVGSGSKRSSNDRESSQQVWRSVVAAITDELVNNSSVKAKWNACYALGPYCTLVSALCASFCHLVLLRRLQRHLCIEICLTNSSFYATTSIGSALGNPLLPELLRQVYRDSELLVKIRDNSCSPDQHPLAFILHVLMTHPKQGPWCAEAACCDLFCSHLYPARLQQRQLFKRRSQQHQLQGAHYGCCCPRSSFFHAALGGTPKLNNAVGERELSPHLFWLRSIASMLSMVLTPMISVVL